MTVPRLLRLEWEVAARRLLLWIPLLGWTAVLLIPLVFYHVRPAGVLVLAIPTAKLFVACTTIMLVSQEFTWGTVRQHVIDGVSRRGWLALQLMLALVIALCYTLVLTAVAAADKVPSATGFAVTGPALLGPPNLWLVFAGTGTVLLGYAVMGLFVGVITRRSAVGLGLFVAYDLIGETLLRLVLDNAGGGFAKVTPYLPTSVLSRLANTHGRGYSNPPLGFNFVQMGNHPFLSAFRLSPSACYGVGFGYMVLFGLIAWTLMAQRDL